MIIDRSGVPTNQNETAGYRPDTYAEQLLYLEFVADALKQIRSKPRMVLNHLVAKGQHYMSKYLQRRAGHDENERSSSAGDIGQPQTENSAQFDRAGQLARIVSEIANPLFVALPTFLIVALHTASDWQRAVLWWIVTTLGISAVPLLFVYQGVRRGRYSDHHLSVRTQRLVPLIVGLACAASALILLLTLHASRALLATVTAVLVCGLCTLAITTRWKISFHLVGAAGPATVITLLFGPIGLALVPLVVLVGWARWRYRPIQSLKR